MLERKHKSVLSLNLKNLASRFDDLKVILILQNEMLLLMLFYKKTLKLTTFDDFKVLPSSNSEFHLKIKESLLISRDQPVLNKNEASLPLHLFD